MFKEMSCIESSLFFCTYYRDIAQAVINDADHSRVDDDADESISYRTARSPSPVQRSPRGTTRAKYAIY